MSSKMNQRIFQIKKSLNEFYSSYSSNELEGFATKLIDTIVQDHELNILRGGIPVWTAAIVVVIARLNFLLDKTNKNYQ